MGPTIRADAPLQALPLLHLFQQVLGGCHFGHFLCSKGNKAAAKWLATHYKDPHTAPKVGLIRLNEVLKACTARGQAGCTSESIPRMPRES